MGLSISYLKGTMAATVARWTESLQLLNEALQKEYNHDAMIDEHREVSKLNEVHHAPREFVEDVCDAPGDYDLDCIHERLIKLKENEHVYEELDTMWHEYSEFCAMIDKHGSNWGTGPRF